MAGHMSKELSGIIDQIPSQIIVFVVCTSNVSFTRSRYNVEQSNFKALRYTEVDIPRYMYIYAKVMMFLRQVTRRVVEDP